LKSYNLPNYLRYKEDLKDSIERQAEQESYADFTRDELIVRFLPLVENIARKFSTSDQASGVLDITDLIQSGSIGLIQAVDKIEWATITQSFDPETTIKSFLSKRIKGSIRRALDINRGSIKLPEHKLNEIRKNNGEDEKMVAMFFNSIFLSIDEQMGDEDDENVFFQIPDQSEPYNLGALNKYLTELLQIHLTPREHEVLRLSYGLDCDKHSANDIADLIGVDGPSAYVRISEIKKQAIKKLIDNVKPIQIIDYL
jgi:RNA polymerase sigma factor (sigma-70 family)